MISYNKACKFLTMFVTCYCQW